MMMRTAPACPWVPLITFLLCAPAPTSVLVLGAVVGDQELWVA
jgi:hypothetical protein